MKIQTFLASLLLGAVACSCNGIRRWFLCEFHDGVAKVGEFQKPTLFIDKTGKTLFQLDETKFYPADDIYFSEGLAALNSRSNGMGFIDKQGHATFDY